MKLLLAARVAPEGMIGFFDDLAQGEHPRHVLRYLSTHPSSVDRVALLRELAAKSPGPATPLMSPEEWADVKTICESIPLPPNPPAGVKR